MTEWCSELTNEPFERLAQRIEDKRFHQDVDREESFKAVCVVCQHERGEARPRDAQIAQRRKSVVCSVWQIEDDGLRLCFGRCMDGAGDGSPGDGDVAVDDRALDYASQAWLITDHEELTRNHRSLPNLNDGLCDALLLWRHGSGIDRHSALSVTPDDSVPSFVGGRGSDSPQLFDPGSAAWACVCAAR